MSAIMEEATQVLSAGAQAAYANGDLADIVDADDTLLIASSSKYME